MAGSGRAASAPFQATRIPLRLMFSVYMAPRVQSAGEVTWHRSLMSIRGLSRLLIVFISVVRHQDFSARGPRHQYRKWDISSYSRRLLANNRWGQQVRSRSPEWLENRVRNWRKDACEFTRERLLAGNYLIFPGGLSIGYRARLGSHNMLIMRCLVKILTSACHAQNGGNVRLKADISSEFSRFVIDNGSK